MAVDSKKKENGPGTIYAGFPSSERLRGRVTVIFQVSGFYCRGPEEYMNIRMVNIRMALRPKSGWAVGSSCQCELQSRLRMGWT